MSDTRFLEEQKKYLENLKKNDPHRAYLMELAKVFATELRYVETDKPNLLSVETFFKIKEEIDKRYGAVRDLYFFGRIYTLFNGDRRGEMDQKFQTLQVITSESIPFGFKLNEVILNLLQEENNSYNDAFFLRLLQCCTVYRSKVKLSKNDLDGLKKDIFIYTEVLNIEERKASEIQKKYYQLEQENEKQLKKLEEQENKLAALNHQDIAYRAELSSMMRTAKKLEENIASLKDKKEMMNVKIEKFKKEKYSLAKKVSSSEFKLNQTERKIDNGLDKHQKQIIKLEELNAKIKTQEENFERHRSNLSNIINNIISHQKILVHAKEELEQTTEAVEHNRSELILIEKQKEDCKLAIEKLERVYHCLGGENLSAAFTLNYEGIRRIDDYTDGVKKAFEIAQLEIQARYSAMQVIANNPSAPLKDTTEAGGNATYLENCRKRDLAYQVAMQADKRAKAEQDALLAEGEKVDGRMNEKVKTVHSRELTEPLQANLLASKPAKKQWRQNPQGNWSNGEETKENQKPNNLQTKREVFVSEVDDQDDQKVNFAEHRSKVAAFFEGKFNSKPKQLDKTELQDSHVLGMSFAMVPMGKN